MAYTFLEVTNLILREVNEVPLSDQQFINARGLQKFCKEAVNRAYFDISNVSTDWPWLRTPVANTADTEIRALTDGIQWYDINNMGDQLTINWDSFLLTDKDLVVNDPLVTANLVRKLPMITYETWLDKYRVKDFGNTGTPEYVIRHPSGKYGFSPTPDGNYWVEYSSSNTAKRFTQPSDVLPFPEEFISVLLARGKYYVWLFRENVDQARMSRDEYDQSLKDMKRALLSNKESTMRAI